MPKVITNQGDHTNILSTEWQTTWPAAIRHDDLTESIVKNNCVYGIHLQSRKAVNLWDKFDLDWVANLHLRHWQAVENPQTRKAGTWTGLKNNRNT